MDPEELGLGLPHRDAKISALGHIFGSRDMEGIENNQKLGR